MQRGNYKNHKYNDKDSQVNRKTNKVEHIDQLKPHQKKFKKRYIQKNQSQTKTNANHQKHQNLQKIQKQGNLQEIRELQEVTKKENKKKVYKPKQQQIGNYQTNIADQKDRERIDSPRDYRQLVRQQKKFQDTKKYKNNKLKNNRYYQKQEMQQKNQKIGDTSRDYKIKLQTTIPHGDFKRFLKLCNNVIKSANKIQLVYFTNRPLIHCYYTTRNNSRQQQFYLSSIVHENRIKNIAVDIELLWRTFDILYLQVPEDFWPIARFGMLKAEQKKKSWADTINIYKHKQFLKLYYVQQKSNQIHFLLLHKQFRRAQYSSSYIQDKKHQLPYQYRSFQKFKKYLKNQKTKEQVEAFEEMDSDEQDIENQGQQDQKIVLKRINEIVGKDLSWIYNQLKNRKDELDQMNYDSNRKQLLESAVQLQSMIHEFEDRINKVKLMLGNRLNKQELKMYSKMLVMAQKQIQSRLPICLKKSQILKQLKLNNILVLEGQTGSGKSTQLPQFLCEYYKIFQSQNALSVLITQPRKIAVRSLAERVAKQLQQKSRGLIDYQTSIKKMVNHKAKIIFKLDRLVLDELTEDPLLSKYSCLVIDQAHERTISIDVILGKVKDILKSRPDFKVIITSASMDSNKIGSYYDTKPIKIPGKLYPIEQIYEPLCNVKDVKEKTIRFLKDFIFEKDMSKLKDEYYGHLLVFCTGIEQVQFLVQKFKSILNSKSFIVLALHGKLNLQQQRKVFQEHGKIKIIFATKIAETSITIDGIKVVVNPGIDRQLIYDPKTKVTTLQLKFISKSQAIQRAGRAGRTGPGFCFHLYSKEQQQKMQLNKPAEMEIMPLQTVILRLKALKIKNIMKFPFIDPPKQENIKISINSLVSLGCLNYNQQITQIGKFILMIPIQPFLARSIVEALLYSNQMQVDQGLQQNQLRKKNQVQVVHQVIKILCMIVNSQELFQKTNQSKNQIQLAGFQAKKFAGEFQLFNQIYSQYEQYLSKKQNKKQLKQWSQRNKLSLKTLGVVKQNIQQISQIIRISSAKLKNLQNYKQLVLNRAKRAQKLKTKDKIINACLLSSFINNLCLYSDVAQLGYTLVSRQTPLLLSPITILSKNDQNSKWIVCYNITVDQYSRLVIKVAQPITLDFLLNVVDQQILKLFNVNQLQKFNPFYHKIKYQLPSLIFYKVLTDYRNKNIQKQLEFLCKYTFVINQRMNSFVAYHLSDCPLELVEKNIDEYIQGIKKSLYQKLQYIYKDKVTVRFNEKFQIDQFFSQNKQYQITLKSIDNFLGNYIDKLNEQFSTKFNQIQNKTTHNIQLRYLGFIQGQQNIQNLIKQIEEYNKNQQVVASKKFESIINQQIQKRISERKKQIQIFNYNIYHRIFNYNKKELSQLQIQGIKQIIQRKYQIQIRNATKKITLQKKQLKLSKSLSQYTQYIVNFEIPFVQSNPKCIILVYNKCLKIEQIKQKLASYKAIKKFVSSKVGLYGQKITCFFNDYQEVSQENLKNYLLQNTPDNMPSQIQQKIQQSWQYINKDTAYWRQIIEEQLQKSYGNKTYIKYEIKLQKKHICSVTKKQTHNKLYRVQFKIKSNQPNLLKNFTVTSNGGIVQTSIKKYINQIVLTVPASVFETLEYYFYTRVGQLDVSQAKVWHRNSENYQGTEVTNIIFKYQEIYQHIGSLWKNQLIRLIKQIFTPLQLNDMGKYQLLLKENTNSNKNCSKSQFIQAFQSQQNYQVKLYYEQKTQILNIYSTEQNLQGLQKRLLQKLKKKSSQQKKISYKQKGLSKIQRILKQLGCQSYRVDYSAKYLVINTDLPTHQKILAQIATLNATILRQCQICCEQYSQPYRLFNCGHVFCFGCLRNWVISGDADRGVHCPGNCGALVSLYDVRRLSSNEEFGRICERQVNLAVEGSKKYFFCFTPDCYQILDKQKSLQIRNTIHCQKCERSYCFECKQPKHYGRCAMYLSQEEKWEALNIKRCPQCLQGVNKNGGCNHMHCKCGAHFCWKCKDFFKTSDECYKHLRIKHGGIYDDQGLNYQIRNIQARNEFIRRRVNIEEDEWDF